MSIGHFWGLYLLKTRSLVVLQEYGVGGSPNGVQELSRNRLAPVIEIQVKGDICLCLFQIIWIFFWMGSHSYPKIIFESSFQARNDEY